MRRKMNGQEIEVGTERAAAAREVFIDADLVPLGNAESYVFW